MNKLLIVALPLVFSGCFKLRGFYGTRGFESVSRSINEQDIILPEGYTIRPLARGLNFPTSVTFDEKGRIYVIEAGYSYGEVHTTPRLLEIMADGTSQEIARGSSNGPWTSVDFYKGHFYISEGGVSEGGKILKVSPDGKINVLVNNLPSFGDHHTNGAVVGPDGYVYFGQGSATNSGVVGKDNFVFGWLKRKPEFHDIPCEDVILAGENYESPNVLSEEKEKVKTGAYVAFGTETKKGQLIKGSVPCSGSVMRVRSEGGDVELVAWGFRNPYGLAFHHEELYVTDNGYDQRGSRPVFGAGDLLWKAEKGKWYGWPDFSGADSLSGEHFRAREIQPRNLLMKRPGTPPKPVAVMGVHSSSNGLDFSRNTEFGYVGEAFIAQFGDMSPNVGRVYAPVGFKVVRVNTATGEITDFASNKGKVNGPASTLKHGGLERPVAVRFDRSGKKLYVVDFGVMEIPDKSPAPKKNTGVLWVIEKKG